jgi:hypothetical protein
MINDECYYGKKAVLINGIVTFEDGNSYDLNQPICGNCKENLSWDAFLNNLCPSCKELDANLL